jgi:uncharacterized protein (TIGR02646 family)
MRFIAANRPPQELIAWVASSRQAGVELNYDTLGKVEIDGESRDVKEAIKRQRLEDQGYLCAYTLVRIEEESAHVEHLKARSVSKEEGRLEETVDYGNMVACFPANGGDTTYGCGAPVRGSTALVVTPREQRCETALRYRSTGRVEPAQENDDAIRKMLNDVLCLNTHWLLGRRQNAILDAGVAPRSPKPLTSTAASRLAEHIVEYRTGTKLTPFCVAIAHAAQDHVARLRKLAIKRRYAQQDRRPQ